MMAHNNSNSMVQWPRICCGMQSSWPFPLALPRNPFQESPRPPEPFWGCRERLIHSWIAQFRLTSSLMVCMYKQCSCKMHINRKCSETRITGITALKTLHGTASPVLQQKRSGRMFIFSYQDCLVTFASKINSWTCLESTVDRTASESTANKGFKCVFLLLPLVFYCCQLASSYLQIPISPLFSLSLLFISLIRLFIHTTFLLNCRSLRG